MNKTKRIAVCGVFGALAAVLYVVPFFKFPLPFLPSFLKFNFSDIPTLIAGFTYGPLTAFLIHVVKIIIKLPMTSTGFVGELADFIVGLLFVMPAVIWYKKDKTKKGALVGLVISFSVATIGACFVNKLILLPFYGIQDSNWNLTLTGILPFNAIKNIIVCALAFILYKKISNVIKKYGAK